jgi:hypothetical protein
MWVKATADPSNALVILNLSHIKVLQGSNSNTRIVFIDGSVEHVKGEPEALLRNAKEAGEHW